MLSSKNRCVCRNHVFDDTLTQLCKTWKKEVPYGSPNADYPWPLNGGVNENSLVLTPDYPLSDGCKRLVWQARSENKGADGGYNGPSYEIDSSKEYRRWVYIKKRGDRTNGTSYMGIRNTNVVDNKSGASNTNPYFWHSDLPEADKWYLLVGHIYPHDTENSNELKGGIYELRNINKVANISREFRWKDDTVHTCGVRDYLFYTSKNGIRQDFFQPNLDLVDGTEMPLELLLGLDVK